MIKILKIFVLLLIVVSKSFAQQLSVNIHLKKPVNPSKGDTIYYTPDTKLIWDDFKGNPEETGNIGAITSAGFGYKSHMTSQDDNAYLTIDIYCSFIKDRSWAKVNKKTDYVLNHEQHHFDIAYIATGMFIRKLEEAKLTVKNYRKMIKEIYNDSYSFMSKLQEQYDKETNNGQLEDKQAEWNKKIEELLQRVDK